MTFLDATRRGCQEPWKSRDIRMLTCEPSSLELSPRDNVDGIINYRLVPPKRPVNQELYLNILENFELMFVRYLNL
jgi:hypothetical protein